MWIFDGKLLKTRRKEAGLSMEKLAAKSGTNHTTISKIESKNRSVNAETLGRIATALGVSPNYFYRKEKKK